MNESNPTRTLGEKKLWYLPQRLLVILGLVGLATFVAIFCVESVSAKNDLTPLRILIESALGAVGIPLASAVLIIFVRWLSRGQNLRRAMFGFACLITLIALFYAEENWRGKRAWEKYKRAEEAKGVKFDVRAFAPPEVPDERNLAKAPLLNAALDYTHTADGVRWNDTNAFARLNQFRVYPPPDSSFHLVEQHLEKGIFLNLESVREMYRRHPEFPQPAVSGTAAQDILVALGRFDAEFKDLQEAATRPEGRFPLEYDYDPPAAILLPHLSPLRAEAMNLQLRSVACLEAGQVASAFNDLRVALRLADSIKAEPFMVSHRVRIDMVFADVQIIREGIYRHAWTEAQLAEMQRELTRIDLLAEYRQADQGTRALEVSDLDWCRRQGFRFDTSLLYRSQARGSSATIPQQLIRFIPGGWFYQNMLALSRLHDEQSSPLVDEKARRVDVGKCKSADHMIAQLMMQKKDFYGFYVQLLMPILGRPALRTGEGQTYVDAARVACALERYRLATGRSPEKLEALTPTYLDRIPTDVVDGQPLRYRLNPDGSYVLYSIGLNQKDDHGEIGIAKVIDDVPVLDKEKGDWAWQLPVRK